MEYSIAMLKISVGGALIFSTAIVDSPGGPVQVFFDFIIAINGVNLESLGWALLNDTVAILDLYTLYFYVFLYIIFMCIYLYIYKYRFIDIVI